MDRQGKARCVDELSEAERLRRENRMLQVKLRDKEMEIALVKTEGAELCAVMNIGHSSYYKWLTDVTEFKCYEGNEIRKLYLSAILGLYNKRIVAYKIGDSNNTQLVLDNFDKILSLNPESHPLFHSDRNDLISAIE